VVTPGGKLIAGERRLRAAQELGWKEVEVRKIDISNPLLAEQDENIERKSLTKSESVSVAREIEAVEKARAKERQGRPGLPRSEESAEHTADARDAVAAAVGMSHDTLAKATEVVEAAEADPESFGDLVEKMDETGKVDPFHKELKSRRAAAGISEEPVVSDPLEERVCPSCGRDTPAWVLDRKPRPEGSKKYRWVTRLLS
jgi:ParB-like chromosome segregation protein Spo0J